MKLASLALAIALLLTQRDAEAETHSQGLQCVENFFHIKTKVASADDALFDIAPDDANQVMKDIAVRSARKLNPVAIDCEQINKASAFQPWSSDRLPANLQSKQFVIYNPNWIREVLGPNRDMAVFILGHEFGHIVNGDTAESKADAVSDKQKNETRLEMEKKADYAGACSLASVGGAWAALDNLIPRIRGIKDVNYPSAEMSLDIAREAFAACGGRLEPDPRETTKVVYWYKRADNGKVIEALNAIGAHLDVRQSGVYQGVDFSDRETDAIICSQGASIGYTRRIALALYDAGIELRGISAPDAANTQIANRITIEAAAKDASILSRQQIVDLKKCPAIDDPIYGRWRYRRE